MDKINDFVNTQLSNGLTVLIKEAHTAPVASFWVWYRVGSRNEHTGITGISHWVEHMLFKGTQMFPKGAAEKAIAREGGVFNGMTWYDFTTYYETLPANIPHILNALARYKFNTLLIFFYQKDDPSRRLRGLKRKLD